MSIDPMELHAKLLPAFEALSSCAVDLQTDMSERLSLIDVATGAKPSFAAYADVHGRRPALEAIAKLLPGGLRSGFGEMDVHHRYRPFKIADADLLATVTRRATCVQPVFWATRDDRIAEAYAAGRPDRIPDDELLGYPRCCVEWHYDVFFARGLEAFCAVAAADGSEEMFGYLREMWRPESGFYLPDRLFLAAILRSNARFPFVEHIACPACLGSDDSPSGELDDRRSTLALTVDREGHGRLLVWAKRQTAAWQTAVAGRAKLFDENAWKCAATPRGRDEYVRHARYLARAMGL